MVFVRVNAMVKGMVNDMAKGKSKPPSRVRYEQSHPVIAIRVDEETSKRLRNLAEESGKSLTTLIKENLGVQEAEYHKAWRKGYQKGVKECQIWYYCSVCSGRIDVKPNTSSHEALIKYMKEHGWAHSTCHSG